ncbi:DUF6056 family protein [Butyrivibrio sp. FCS006]|uniref:DUF6056 family protein n=1 Tax=Butyrivibrio sp. FCS006 TaxID=1280684 RepID=UPI001A991302|nr:DUF6056 family protein [Butyrivibrio sp. FCS006]
MRKKDTTMTVTAIVLTVITIALLIPFIYVSKYAYPWADDFSYGTDARMVYLSTHSVLKTIGEAIRSTAAVYMDWQGTYTSCFLMSLQPAVWNIKLYHLTGLIMAISMLGAYVVLGLVVFKRLWKMSFPGAISISLLAYLVSAERVIGIAEAFTWYNSAVHYTYMNSLLVFFVSMVALYVFGKNRDERKPISKIVLTALLCLLGVVTAGSNNVTALTGMLVMLVFGVAIMVLQEKGHKLNCFLAFLPMMIAYAFGFLANMLSPGNRARGGTMGADIGHLDVVDILVKAFKVCTMDIADKFSLELLAVLLGVGIIAWRELHKIGDKGLRFSFGMPVLVVLASYCLLAAMYCPMLAVEDTSGDMLQVFGIATEMARTENVVYFNMVLLMAFDVVYCLGWLYQKGFRVYSPLVGALAAVVAVIICLFGIRTEMMTDKGQHYLTTTAIDNWKNGTAAYYGYQMEENTNRLMSEDEDVYVMPFGVNPNTLYPYDASDWIEGTRLFYQKNSVTYESEPYVFER